MDHGSGWWNFEGGGKCGSGVRVTMGDAGRVLVDDVMCRMGIDNHIERESQFRIR